MMKMAICFLILLIGVAAATKPVSGYGEPKPIRAYTPQPQSYEPVVYHRVPVIEHTKPSHGGILGALKSKIASKKGAKLSKLGKLKSKIIPLAIGFKLGGVIMG